jgi:hypothetical protein
VISAVLRSFFVAALVYFYCASSRAQNDIARGFCQSHLGLIDVVLGIRMNGMPISIAEDAVDSTFKVDRRLWSVMRATVRLTYSDPKRLGEKLRSGEWINTCASYLQGY